MLKIRKHIYWYFKLYFCTLLSRLEIIGPEKAWI